MNDRVAHAPRQRGFSLIEVLVSVLLISFGLLAMSAMQSYAITAGQTALYRGLAVSLATEYADLVRANRTAFEAGRYDVTDYLPDAPAVDLAKVLAANCAYPTCTAAALAQYEIAMFKQRVRASLPKGAMYVERAVVAGIHSKTEADLWIVWKEPQLFKAPAGGGEPATGESEFDSCPQAVKELEHLPRCIYMRVALQ